MRRAAALGLFLVVLAGCTTAAERRARTEANPAPCPNIFVLQDAARFVEFSGDEETFDTLAYSGEVMDVSTSCRYFLDRPIEATASIDFAIGRGPAAPDGDFTAEYFVAVTRTDRDVIAKEVFSLPVTFRRGQDIVEISRTLDRIVIPRLNENTSGVNFEIAVGFALSRDQVLYNRAGRSLKFPEA